MQSPIAAIVRNVEYFRVARDSDSVMKSPDGAYIGKGLVLGGIGVLIGLAMGTAQSVHVLQIRDACLPATGEPPSL